MKLNFLLSTIIMVVMASCSNTKTENNMIANNALEVLKTRRAIRAYQDKMPEKELIAQTEKAGLCALYRLKFQCKTIITHIK